MKIMKPNVNRALIFQGGGSLGAYEAGAYNAINEDMSAYFRTEGRENLSTQPAVENIPYFTSYWDSWRKLDRRIASGESARRYFSTKEFILKGVPNVFVPKTPQPDHRFFDPSNTWYIYDNRPLKESLEKFVKFPISTSFESNEPRLLLVAVDVQDLTPVVFDS